MPRSKNTTRRPKSKTPVLNHPAKQKVAPTPLLEQWAKTACAYDGNVEPAARASALLMICAEIEASANDSARIWAISWTLQKAVFAESEQGEEALRELIEKLRAKNGLRAVA